MVASGPSGRPGSPPALRRHLARAGLPRREGRRRGRKRLCGHTPPPQVSECGPGACVCERPGAAAAAASSEPRQRVAFRSVGWSRHRAVGGPRGEPSVGPRPRGDRPPCARGGTVPLRPPAAERLSQGSGPWESRSDSRFTRNNNAMRVPVVPNKILIKRACHPVSSVPYRHE